MGKSGNQAVPIIPAGLEKKSGRAVTCLYPPSAYETQMVHFIALDFVGLSAS
jgi:hypothetical protein